MLDNSHYTKIPLPIVSGINNYVLHSQKPGGFLQAVLKNDLSDAIVRADEQNLLAIKDIVLYLHNECPGNCFGSPKLMQAWLSRSSAEIDRTRKSLLPPEPEFNVVDAFFGAVVEPAMEDR